MQRQGREKEAATIYNQVEHSLLFTTEIFGGRKHVLFTAVVHRYITGNQNLSNNGTLLMHFEGDIPSKKTTCPQGLSADTTFVFTDSKQVLKSKPSDIGLVAVASNNLLCLNRDQNIFDSKKRLKAATVEGLELKLTSSQRRQIARNSALLAMFTAQVSSSNILERE